MPVVCDSTKSDTDEKKGRGIKMIWDCETARLIDKHMTSTIYRSAFYPSKRRFNVVARCCPGSTAWFGCLTRANFLIWMPPPCCISMLFFLLDMISPIWMPGVSASLLHATRKLNENSSSCSSPVSWLFHACVTYTTLVLVVLPSVDCYTSS